MVRKFRFCKDKWLENTPLKDQYSALYNIIRYKSDTLATVMQSSPSVMMFRRNLVGARLEGMERSFRTIGLTLKWVGFISLDP